MELGILEDLQSLRSTIRNNNQKKQGPKPDYVEATANVQRPSKPSYLSKEQLKVISDRFN